MTRFLERLEQTPRRWLITAMLGYLALVGTTDYLTGIQISMSVFYLAAVVFATWFISRGFGSLTVVFSVLTYVVADEAAGAKYSSLFVPIWNALVLGCVYLAAVWLTANLRASQKDLESKVRQRTSALSREIVERERLEKEILEVSEREQQRIGRDLHDSVCQHLAATAMAGHVLGEKLALKRLPEAADARDVVKLVEDGLTLTRNLAHGISPMELDAEGLLTAFREFANNISKIYKLPCKFEHDASALVNDPVTGTHLYRIAQEAVTNAIRHAKPRQIVINLGQRKECVELTVEDDGAGLPDDWQKSRGLGTRIMAHRAAMIGGTLSIEPNPTGGTFIKCSLPDPNHQPKATNP